LPVPGKLPGQVHADVAAFHGERVLVESGQQRVVFFEHVAQPGVRPFVHVGHVRHHLDDGPFPRGGAPADPLVVQAGHQGAGNDRAGPQRLEDLLVQVKHRFHHPASSSGAISGVGRLLAWAQRRSSPGRVRGWGSWFVLSRAPPWGRW